jgi:hypothetical protein
LYYIWKEEGWKGSVNALHLVMALHDHFAHRDQVALAAIRTIADDSNTEAAEQKVEEIADVARETSGEDLWTLQFMTVMRVDKLIEALDDDVSSFVTISEVNGFTASRPSYWR